MNNNQLTNNNNSGNKPTKQEHFGSIEISAFNSIDNMLSNGITFPVGYNPQKAVTGALMRIQQDDKLMNCKKDSILESLMQMVTLGLDVNATQCYLIPYGGECKLSVSYFGKQTAVKRIKGVIDVVAQPIFSEDSVDYDIEDGIVKNLQHKTSFGSRKSGIAGAYAIIKLDSEVFGREQHIEIMDMDEIKASWGMGATKGNSPAHRNFKGEMAKKSVISRACKNFINTITDEKDIELVRAYNETLANDNITNEKKGRAMDVEVVEQNFGITEEETQPIENVQQEQTNQMDQQQEFSNDQQSVANLFDEQPVNYEDISAINLDI